MSHFKVQYFLKLSVKTANATQKQLRKHRRRHTTCYHFYVQVKKSCSYESGKENSGYQKLESGRMG